MKVDKVAWLLLCVMALVPLVTIVFAVLAILGEFPLWTLPVFIVATALNGYWFIKALREQLAWERRGP